MAERPWSPPTDPLDYRLRTVDGMQVLARDPVGNGRIVEVLGDLEAAARIAVVVPGNAHTLATYRTNTTGGSPRRNGLALAAALADVAPEVPTAVVVWLGYDPPRGLLQAARRRAALESADDLRRLTHVLPEAAEVVLIGHSYGSVVCGLAVPGARVADLVALGSPGLGVTHASQLTTSARIWATRGVRDWVRFMPRGQLGGLGHGRQPTDAAFGARLIPGPPGWSHAGYYTPGSAFLADLARVTAGTYETRARTDPLPHQPSTLDGALPRSGRPAVSG